MRVLDSKLSVFDKDLKKGSDNSFAYLSTFICPSKEMLKINALCYWKLFLSPERMKKVKGEINDTLHVESGFQI